MLNSGSITMTVSVMALKSVRSLVLCSLSFSVTATSSWFFFTSRSFWFSRSSVRARTLFSRFSFCSISFFSNSLRTRMSLYPDSMQRSPSRSTKT